MNDRNITRRAMTAVEVLAATVLASLMLASVMGVLGGLTRQQRSLRIETVEPAWHRLLAEQLRWDLENSRELFASPSGVRMFGFAGRDFASGRATGRPTAIEYQLLAVENDVFLVRREEQLDARTNDSWRVEVACRGVSRFDFGTMTVDKSAADPLDLRRSDPGQPIPLQVAVRLYPSEGGPPTFDRLLVIR